MAKFFLVLVLELNNSINPILRGSKHLSWAYPWVTDFAMVPEKNFREGEQQILN
jgi:hypothetical protein